MSASAPRPGKTWLSNCLKRSKIVEAMISKTVSMKLAVDLVAKIGNKTLSSVTTNTTARNEKKIVNCSALHVENVERISI